PHLSFNIHHSTLPYIPSYPPRRSSDLEQKRKYITHRLKKIKMSKTQDQTAISFGDSSLRKFLDKNSILNKKDELRIPSDEWPNSDRKSTRLNSSHVKIS